MSNKMVKCKACNADMAKSAKACPACGAKNKKPIFKKWWFWAIIVVILIAIIGGGGEDDEPKKVGETEPAAPSQSEMVQTEFGVGEIVEMSNIRVTMTEVKESDGSEYNRPDEGNVFVGCFFEIENDSASEINVSSILCFEAYVDDYSIDESFSACLEFDGDTLDGTVASGKKMKGCICYELPADYQTLEIHFTPDYWSGKDITFVANT